jgi:hypothetical protein
MHSLIKRVVSPLFLMQSLRPAAGHTIANPLPQYTPVPGHLELGHVIVIHRHGDRAQISRVLGSAYPESETLASEWRSKLPSERSRKGMLLAAHPGENLVLQSADADAVDVERTLYSGWDAVNSPYAQLTEVGCAELRRVGAELRMRYVQSGFLSPDLAQASGGSLYLRSTSMCRTQQSLRSLLSGLFALDPDAHPFNSTPTLKSLSLLGAPRIFTQVRHLETMYPTADGSSSAMNARRAVVLPPGLVASSISGYGAFEARMRVLCGFTDKAEKVNWLQCKEVLTCHLSHNITHVSGWSAEDVEKASEITGFTWGALYKDDALNRLAIGRFMHDLRQDLTAAMTGQPRAQAQAEAEALTSGQQSEGSSVDSTQTQTQSSAGVGVGVGVGMVGGGAPCPAGKRLLIYSGHDSTLVPVLCALGIYDGKYPHLT